MNNLRNALRRKAAGFTLVEIMIVVLIIGILLAIAIPNFVTARDSSRARACVANLKQIDSATQQYVMDNKLSPTSTGTPIATQAELAPTYIREFPSCPSGGTYTIGDGTASSTGIPTCSYGTSDGTQFDHALT